LATPHHVQEPYTALSFLRVEHLAKAGWAGNVKKKKSLAIHSPYPTNFNY